MQLVDGLGNGLQGGGEAIAATAIGEEPRELLVSDLVERAQCVVHHGRRERRRNAEESVLCVIVLQALAVEHDERDAARAI